VRDAVICAPVRTPVGKLGGALKWLDAEALAAIVVAEVVRRSGIPSDDIDDCVFAQCYPSGESPAIGRTAALRAGLPTAVPGLQLDRRCGSGLQAVCFAAMQVQTEVADLVLAGGVESMSNVEFYTNSIRWGPVRGSVQLLDRLDRARATAGSACYPVSGGMIETAENLRRCYGVSRQEQDEYALTSHIRAAQAWEKGQFDAEVVVVEVQPPRGDSYVVSRDEHPRADASLAAMAKLKPIRMNDDPEATVTAGNASGENDAAACCLVTHPDMAKDLGLQPLARLVSWAVAGVDPSTMGIGPVPAVQKLLSKTGLSLSDMELIELNEAFAVQVLACAREWDLRPKDFERLNVKGSGISLGHPVGATGVRILATLLHEMKARGARYGLETMCIGGGQGIAAIFEHPN
jgi:acetyl-CoA C-acetyltransferase